MLNVQSKNKLIAIKVTLPYSILYLVQHVARLLFSPCYWVYREKKGLVQFESHTCVDASKLIGQKCDTLSNSSASSNQLKSCTTKSMHAGGSSRVSILYIELAINCQLITRYTKSVVYAVYYNIVYIITDITYCGPLLWYNCVMCQDNCGNRTRPHLFFLPMIKIKTVNCTKYCGSLNNTETLISIEVDTFLKTYTLEELVQFWLLTMKH